MSCSLSQCGVWTVWCPKALSSPLLSHLLFRMVGRLQPAQLWTQHLASPAVLCEAFADREDRSLSRCENAKSKYNLAFWVAEPNAFPSLPEPLTCHLTDINFTLTSCWRAGLGYGWWLKNVTVFSKAFGLHASVFQPCEKLSCEIFPEEWCGSDLMNLLTGLVDKGETVGTAHPAVRGAFNTALHNRLICKVRKHGIE